MQTLIRNKNILMTTAVFLLCAASASAHPANAINLSYNKTTREITVNVAHPSTMPNWHFTQRIEFVIDDVVVENKAFTEQTTENGTTYAVRLKNAKPGDTVIVNAYCSRSGMKTASIVIDSGIESSIDSSIESSIDSTIDSTKKSGGTRRKSY